LVLTEGTGVASQLVTRNREIYANLQTVETAGQALVAALRAVKQAEQVQVELAGYPFDIAAQNAIRQLGNYIREIKRYAEPLAGSDPNAPVSEPSWKPLRNTIGGMYGFVWAVEDTLSADARETFASFVATVFIDAIQAFPKVIEATLEGVGTVVGAAGAGVSKGLGQIIKGAWPILLAAAVVIGAGIYLATSTGAGRAVLKARAGA
jgi:hypothetical protein